MKLFCFPFAGGSCYSYRVYLKYAPKELNIVPLDLPGRGLRSDEPLLRNIDSIINDLYKRIRPQLNAPYAFYGHSMGTVLAYLVTKRICQDGLPAPRYLFVTGRGGPSLPEKESPNYLLPKEEFKRKIKEMAGVPQEVMNNDELMDYFEPILRADFQALEEYKYQETPPFDIPVVVCVGDDEKVSTGDALLWKKETTAHVDIRWFAGKHFFIFQHAEAIMKIITGKLGLSSMTRSH